MQGFDSAWNAADTVALREYLEEDLMAFRRGADGRWRLVATN
jgi:hypothetical protein